MAPAMAGEAYLDDEVGVDKVTQADEAGDEHRIHEQALQVEEAADRVHDGDGVVEGGVLERGARLRSGSRRPPPPRRGFRNSE